MPKFLRPHGRSNMGIAICDTCGLKKYHSDLKNDGNNPGLKVCNKCYDQIDFHRVPYRPHDRITLGWVRPDVDIEIDG